MDEPVTLRGDSFYIRAFWELSSCRQFGQVVGPIPWHHIVDYARFYHLDADMAEVFTVVMRELDETYLKDQREKQ